MAPLEACGLRKSGKDFPEEYWGIKIRRVSEINRKFYTSPWFTMFLETWFGTLWLISVDYMSLFCTRLRPSEEQQAFLSHLCLCKVWNGASEGT